MRGMLQVSSSGVTLTHGYKGSIENIGENDIDQGMYEDQSFDNGDDENANAKTEIEELPGKQFVMEKYPHLTIIDGRYLVAYRHGVHHFERLYSFSIAGIFLV